MQSNRRKDPTDRKKEIIDTALNLFLEFGYENVTINKIASKSNITKGLCYHYFPSKESLFDEALSDFVNNLTNEYLEIIKNRELSLNKRMDEMSLVLRKYQGRSLFYDFSRQSGNNRVYLEVLYRTFDNLIPALTDEYISYVDISKKAKDEVETLMSFILHGQIGILTKKGEKFNDRSIWTRLFIDDLLNNEGDRWSNYEL